MSPLIIIGIAVVVVLLVIGGAYYYVQKKTSALVCATCPVCATTVVASAATTPTYTLSAAKSEHAGDDIRLYRDVSIDDAKALCNANPKCVAISYSTAWTGQDKISGGAILKSASSINNTGFAGDFYIKN